MRNSCGVRAGRLGSGVGSGAEPEPEPEPVTAALHDASSVSGRVSGPAPDVCASVPTGTDGSDAVESWGIV